MRRAALTPPRQFDYRLTSCRAGVLIISIVPSRGRFWRIATALSLAIAGASTSFDSSPALAASEGEITKADFFEPGLAPVRQAGPYDVTIVYFMDYQCPACRKHTPDVAKALGEDRRVRVIYRDTPIFGPRSEQAARAAIASQFQGKHQAMHHALMTSAMPLDEQALRAAADKAGVDWDRLQRDLKARSDEIDSVIAWNTELSRAAGVSGTPAFIVGDILADGALDYRGLKAEIADARAKNPKQSLAEAPAPVAAAAAETASASPPAPATDDIAAAAPSETAATEGPANRTRFERNETPAEADALVSQQSGGSANFAVWASLAVAAAALGVFAWAARRRRA